MSTNTARDDAAAATKPPSVGPTMMLTFESMAMAELMSLSSTRIVSEVSRIGCGDGLGKPHHKAQERRAEQGLMPVALPKTRIAAPVASVPTMLSKK